jgi:hypothetical protein
MQRVYDKTREGDEIFLEIVSWAAPMPPVGKLVKLGKLKCVASFLKSAFGKATTEVAEQATKKVVKEAEEAVVKEVTVLGKEEMKMIKGGIAEGGFSVNPSKFDYFFGRVVSGSEHNIARSAQNLKDLTTLGIKSESQLMNVFGQALESGSVISTKTSQYGTTVMRSVNVGNQGSINVGFFYQGGNMSATPSISTIIPKIFK